MTPRCLLCGSDGLRPCFDAPAGSVTSDCRPWPLPPKTTTCARCGHLQKADTGPRLDEIYAGYRLYRLSDGAEQVVFSGGAASPRSAVLAEKIEPWLPPGARRMLDVGCGNGATLRAFHARHPGWELNGFEIDDKTRAAVLAVPGVRGFFAGSPDAIQGSFDLITLVHVFEHVTTPGDLLDRLRARLAPGGLLLLEQPNALESPFDMAIIDHCSHFSPGILAAFAASRGYEVVHVATDWLSKEVAVLLRAGAAGPAWPPPGGAPAEDVRRFHAHAAWLVDVVRDAEARASKAARFGVFGTAIAGTWLGSLLGERVNFFVDDDPRRAGKLHLGRPVLPTSEVDPGATVYLAFPPAIAARLRARLAKESTADWVAPPGA